MTRPISMMHVALVTAVVPGAYTISEMNAVAWGVVSTRQLNWPDPHVLGFIPVGADSG